MAACAAIASLNGCGTTAPARPETAGAPKAMAYLFISPMGEPFRKGPKGEAPFNVWFAQADKDGDKRISQAEFLADAQAFFLKLDADKDGKVVSSEVTAMQQRLAPEEIKVYGPLEDLVGVEESVARQQLSDDPTITKRQSIMLLERPYGAQAFGLLNDIEPVMSADYDVNRRVTPDEFAKAAEHRFARLDLNHDGYFAVAETPQPYWPRQEKRNDR